MVDQEISEHRVAEGLADERCHHRVSQGRAPLSQPKVRKILDTTSYSTWHRSGCDWRMPARMPIRWLGDQKQPKNSNSKSNPRIKPNNRVGFSSTRSPTLGARKSGLRRLTRSPRRRAGEVTARSGINAPRAILAPSASLSVLIQRLPILCRLGVETQIDGHLDLVTAILARPDMTDFEVAHVCRRLWCDQ